MHERESTMGLSKPAAEFKIKFGAYARLVCPEPYQALDEGNVLDRLDEWATKAAKSNIASQFKDSEFCPFWFGLEANNALLQLFLEVVGEAREEIALKKEHLEQCEECRNEFK